MDESLEVGLIGEWELVENREVLKAPTSDKCSRPRNV
jgi:hypothetical protein